MRAAPLVVAVSVTAVLAETTINFDELLPSVSPTATTDFWRCTTMSLQEYFNPPQPTGDLLTMLVSYGDKIMEGCEKTITDYRGFSACTFPPQSAWCSVTDVLPSSLESAYSAYGSTASSWWANHSSDALDLATFCPSRWFKAQKVYPGGPAWLNDTIAFGGCYAEAHATGGAAITTMSATTSAAASHTAAQSTTTATKHSSAPSYLRNAKRSLAVGAVLAAAAVNALF